MNEILHICNTVDGPRRVVYFTRVFHSAWWNKPDREKQILYVITYTWNLKNKTEPDSQIQKMNGYLWEQGKVEK